ncbi:MAG: CBS domain-containing protein [Thermoplasmata archaeon]|nr:MAG: CBS domain-containing protein [Thermoplasmata archaeon]
MSTKDEVLISEFYELKVEQIMDKKIWDLPLIGKKAPISHVLSILDGKSHVWVVNDIKWKELLGIITRRDVLNILAPPRTYYNIFSLPKHYQHGTKGKAEDVMSRDPIVAKSDEKIVDVLQKMIKHKKIRLAVVSNDGKIEGEVTLRHLICKFYKASQFHSIID